MSQKLTGGEEEMAMEGGVSRGFTVLHLSHCATEDKKSHVCTQEAPCQY